MKRAKLHILGHSSEAEKKREIQDLVREIVIKRDGGCIFRVLPAHVCSGYAKDGHLILQADHLISRANSATYADTRLIVCICMGMHGWKHWHEKEYDALVKTILPKARIKLWERCELDRQQHRGRPQDWSMHILALRKELKEYN